MSRPGCRFGFVTCLLAAVWIVLSAVTPVWSQSRAAAVQPSDWQTLVRQRATAQDLPGALALVEKRLAESPRDVEARGWHARILAWMGRWTEAEAEYRQVLKQAPNDVDYLIGLAGVLGAQERSQDALRLLDQARTLDRTRIDVDLARGRTLRALGRRAEARDAFRDALGKEPQNVEARRGLDSVREDPRHHLSVGADFDRFNYTAQGAEAYSYALRSVWRPRWTTDFGLRLDHRSGVTAGRWSGVVAARLSPRATLTGGGSAGPANGVVSKGELFFDLGSGFTFGRRGFVRGLETNYQQRWLWFDAVRVLTLRSSALLYLPRDWMWSVAVTAARSSFSGLGADWRPSAVTRLTFPLGQQVAGHVFIATGTENYALRDQIGRFSARTYGSGARLLLPGRQQLTGYVAYQRRTQGRTQTSVGFAHAVRF